LGLSLPEERAEHIILNRTSSAPILSAWWERALFVEDLMTIESYAHVHHKRGPSNVSGILRPRDTTDKRLSGGISRRLTIIGVQFVVCISCIARVNGAALPGVPLG